MAKLRTLVAFSTATAIGLLASRPAECGERATDRPVQATVAGSATARAISDPVTRFTLPNGLKVVVQTNKSVPLVSAVVVYHVGAKDEEAGQYGYAHLFEHLALDGSAHWNENALRSLRDMGATNVDARTTRDTTTFLSTVPRAALERLLFLEADRMGFIGAALTPERVEREVGVVLNEKRMRASRPFGTSDASIFRDLYPADHPYHHGVVGEEADLNAVTVEKARRWFDAYYGPSNATLILAGDVTGDEARRLVAKYFGGLQPGTPIDRLETHAPTLKGPIRREMFGAASEGQLYVDYPAPPAGSPAMAALDLTAQIMANGARSRFTRRLVNELGIVKSAFVIFDAGILSSVMGFGFAGVAPDQMPRVEAEVDAMIARYVAEGPTPEELESAKAARINYIRSLQGSTSGKAFLLTQGAGQNQTPNYAEDYFQQLLTATPESVRRAVADVYGRPGYHLVMLPNPLLKATAGGYDLAQGPPPVGPITPIAFPAVEQTELANGLKVVLVPRPDSVSDALLLRFEDGGEAGGSREIASIALDILAAEANTAPQRARREAADALRGRLNEKVELDHADLTFVWDAAQLAPGIALFGRALTRPDVTTDAVAQVKTARIDRLRAEMVNPKAGALRALNTAIYGAGHPYAPAATAADAIREVEALDPAAVREWMLGHLRPDRATLYVAADADMATLKPLLEKALGDWKVEGPAASVVPIPPAHGRPTPSLTVLDNPGASQTYIMAGKVIPAAARPDGTDAAAVQVVNEIYGGNSTSRIGTNLRGDKGWTYGIGSGVYDTKGQRRWIIAGTVDADHSADSVAELIEEMRLLAAARPPEQNELDRIVTTAANRTAAQLEGNTDLVTAMADAQSEGLPYNDMVREAMRLGALTIDQVKDAVPVFADPDTVHWVIVGDWDRIRDQFANLHLGTPEVIEPPQ